MESSSSNLVFKNGVLLPATSGFVPPVSTFLEYHSGAYTTTRTHLNASRLLFWDRHVDRLCNSLKILHSSKPEFLFGAKWEELSLMDFDSFAWLRNSVQFSVDEALMVALRGRSEDEEVALTALVTGDAGRLSEGVVSCFDVYVHVGAYVGGVFGGGGSGARLALVGLGREVAAAKYSDWVRLRKPLMKLKPPLATESLLSNDGDHILEGCVTNFFVVCRKDTSGIKDSDLRKQCFVVQTAPICDGVLPGIIRQVVIEVCTENDIPLQVVAPSWSERERWEEAFVTSSLRILQHVTTIEVPDPWESLGSQTLKEVPWAVKHFKEGPGMITTLIQKEVMKKAGLEGYQLT